MARSNNRRNTRRSNGRKWRRIDLHLHTPGSGDYQEPQVTYLDILRQAEARGLDIIAFTDHNSVAGYAAMRREIDELEFLEQLDRLQANESRRLAEYRRLLDKILVLPGFEFTATFGFHILGIFSDDTPVAYLEHLLLTLNVPIEQLPVGSSTVGATSDVLTAYRMINQSGGLVIAAHANSGNGVGMRGLDFGGQTKIAYTQDPNLHCLEVTDLEKRGRYSTRRFFDGSKPEYPRAMRCIQGSDAHRLMRDPVSPKNLGVGDRVTEILLDNVTFEALANVIKGNDFSLTRPYRGPASPVDFVQLAREEGPSIVQAFHKTMAKRGGHLNRILEDVCAMANTNGGTIYVGLSPDVNEKIVGVREPRKAIKILESTFSRRVSPDPEVNIDILSSQGQPVVRITLPPGREVPYAIDDNRFYVRDEADTTPAVRDEIVRLVERRILGRASDRLTAPIAETPPEPLATTTPPEPAQRTFRGAATSPPRTGVEIVSSEKRDGTIYHTVRDLRNGNLINNVTRSSARKLWHYAITKTEAGVPSEDKIEWHNNLAFLNVRRRDSHVWYDLAMRDQDGMHFYYGVTDSGLNEEWMEMVEKHVDQ
ncbi:MAG: putative DNA binding domain-containing protein [Chloroflexota bacterium]